METTGIVGGAEVMALRSWLAHEKLLLAEASSEKKISLSVQ